MPAERRDERLTRDSLFKSKLTKLREQDRAKADEGKKVIQAQSQLVSSTTSPHPEEELSIGKERHTVLKDPKTGLYTERFIRRVLKEEVKRAKRYKNSLGIILGAIINAEEIEQSGGPIAMAAIAVEAAKVIQECIRDVDVPGKMGDGSYVVICPETGEVGLQVIIDRLNRRLNYNQKLNLHTTWEPIFCFAASAYGTSINNADFLVSSTEEKLTLSTLETRAEMDNTVHEEKW